MSLVSLIVLVGCRPASQTPKQQSASPQGDHIALAKQFLVSELGVEWTKDSDQDRETQMPITLEFWTIVMGDVVYQDKKPFSADSQYIRVTLSKDFQKYYEDYEFLIEAGTKRVVSIKKRKWDG